MIQTGWLLATLGIAMSCNDLDKSTNNDTRIEQNTTPLTNVMSISRSQKNLSTKDIYTKVAVETCDCLQPILEKVKHLKEYEQSKETLEKKKTAAEIEVMQPEIQKCSDEISVKYSSINKSIDQKRLMVAILGQCPDASILFSNLVHAK